MVNFEKIDPNSKIEKEVGPVDLDTYLRTHKEIILPNAEVDKYFRHLDRKTRKSLKLKRGLSETDLGTEFGTVLRYVDKDENIARVNIDFERIDGFKELIKRKAGVRDAAVQAQLSRLGFSFGFNIYRPNRRDSETENFWHHAHLAFEEYEKKLQGKAPEIEIERVKELHKRAEEERQKEFDF